MAKRQVIKKGGDIRCMAVGIILLGFGLMMYLMPLTYGLKETFFNLGWLLFCFPYVCIACLGVFLIIRGLKKETVELNKSGGKE